MGAMDAVLHWGWLLGVALVAPAALPAGGGERRQPEIRRCDHLGPLLAGKGCVLRASPLAVAPTLRTLAVGTPVRVLRRWQSADGNTWLQVKTSAGKYPGFIGNAKRGWVNV